MQNFLEDIVAYKKEFIEQKKAKLPLEELRFKVENLPSSRSFKKAISEPDDKLHLIAEVKKASPSAGVICKDFNPLELAKSYEENGASAISVITCEKFFEGNLTYLETVSKNINIPVLRKDFIIDKYQIYEARLFGADAILLIACILHEEQIMDFIKISKELSMDCLVEVHSEEDIKKVLNTPSEIIGINNRDLRTFAVDLSVTEKLVPLIPKDKVIVSESGIKTDDDIHLLQKIPINAILIGQSLLESQDIRKKIRDLGIRK